MDAPTDGPIQVNYGNVPVPKKRSLLVKKTPLKIEEENITIATTGNNDKEPGEIEEN